MQHISLSTTTLVNQTDEVIKLFVDITRSNEINSNSISVISLASEEQYQSVEGLKDVIDSLSNVSNDLNDNHYRIGLSMTYLKNVRNTTNRLHFIT